MIRQELRELFEKQGYGLVGNHSACKICHWTKEAIRGKSVCYKQQFYGIQSHRCLQMTPAVDVCNHNCTFCWRAMDFTGGNMIDDPDEPQEMIDGLIEQQRKLIVGFKGSSTADMRKYEEAQDPNMAAISLSGEPTLYPKLGGLIEEFHKRDFTTFLVTNGTRPDVLRQITEPTQLYVSLDAPTEEMYKKIDRPLIKGGWGALQESLQLFPSLDCRKVVRLTLLRSNMVEPEKYAKLISAASPDYVECKAYMHVGFSRKRLPHEEMPLHQEIEDFSARLSEELGYTVKDRKEDSRVVLLSRQ